MAGDRTESVSPAPSRDLARLISRHRPGHALDRAFYTDAGIFEQDLDRMLLKHWFLAAHASAVPRTGDFRVVDLGAESIIIVRSAPGEIRALLNVCRHRGSRVCTTASGRATAGRLTCPYHAWTYDLEGRLLVARQMPESFDRNDFGLRSLPVRVVEGLVFTTFAREPLDFASAESALTGSAGVHG
jgi:Rieske 2Fe-2S family protein